jgi:glycerophosphoryl diester phosphodiesterase
VESLREPPIGFAHRGGRAHAPDNTMDAFVLGLQLGATGLESDCWVTSDGVVVLDHDGVVRVGRRKRAIADVPRSALPSHVPSLAQLYERCGTAFELSLDVKDGEAGAATIAVARDAGAEERLWLCHHRLETLSGWRPLSPTVHLVDSTRLRHIKEGPERRAATHLDLGIDAVNMHHTDWDAGLVTLWHRFGRMALGWDAQQPRVLDGLLAMGIDGVFSDHVDRMVDALRRRPPPPS